MISLGSFCIVPLQRGYPPQGYVKWMIKFLSRTITQITITQGLALVHIECGARQDGPTSYPFSNTVASFKTRVFANAPPQPHPSLASNYAHTLHHRDIRNTLFDDIIHIVSYFDNNTRYTIALTLQHFSP